MTCNTRNCDTRAIAQMPPMVPSQSTDTGGGSFHQQMAKIATSTTATQIMARGSQTEKGNCNG